MKLKEFKEEFKEYLTPEGIKVSGIGILITKLDKIISILENGKNKKI